MASKKASSPTSESSLSSSAPTKLPEEEGFNLDSFRQGDEAKKLVAWVQSEYSRAKQARTTKQLQWYINMAYFFGQQWVESTRRSLPEGYRNQLMLPKKPYYQQRKIINLTRAFVRTELSKFLSQEPTAVSVPATAEDQDIRSAYAAEQAWESINSSKKLRSHYSRAAWWMIVTGNGFIKTWWDQDRTDKVSGEKGDICFGAITPFHLFVPDVREQDIEDQPFLINAYVKPLEWCKHYFGDALKGVDLQASTASANTILDGGYLNLSSASGNNLDSCVVYETWVKPGGCPLLPEGGVLVTVDDVLISMYRDGLPYEHGMYPFTKFEHIPTSTFYADSPLVDTNQLQKEYNTLRSEISEAGRRSARPQLIVQRGSLVPSKITNEPGLVIEYKPGFQPPQPIPLSPLPQYYLDQQGVIRQDWEDIGGQHDVSRGQAPPGVTAGTAINYLQEKDDQYLTPQYQSIEDGYERIATQTVGLFVQYVDLPRKIKTIGADGAFDTMLLSGADIANGTDIRMEQGSAVGQSKAAQDARLMDMFQVGILDRIEARHLLSIGGAQRVLDLLSVAEKKAQRENIKMKMLEPGMIQQADMEFVQSTVTNPQVLEQAGITDPSMISPEVMQQIAQSAPPVVPVDDFDVHEQHIETHNRFRMSQEYEGLPPEIQEQFAKHVAAHQQAFMQGQMMNFLQQVPSDGTEEGDVGGVDAGMPAGEAPGATLSANGAAPDTAPQTEGALSG